MEFADLWLINTHNGVRESNVPPIDISDYPAVKKHLDQYYDKLEKRQDKGVTPYNLRNCAYLEEFSRPKIVYSEIVQDSQFYLDRSCTYYPEASTFIMTGENTQYLSIMLNSKLLTYAFKTFYSGGGLSERGFRYKKAFLINLPICKPNALISELLIKLNNKYLENYNIKFDILQDMIIYKLYDLSYEEMKLVDPSVDVRLSILHLNYSKYKDLKIYEIARLSDNCS